MKHEADDNFDQDKAMEIIDDNLDSETQCDPESTRLLAQWVKSSPENADEVFKRFILHALLKDHYQQKTYSDMLHTGAGVTPPPVKLSAGAYRVRQLIRYSVLALAMLAVITAAVYIDRNRTGITGRSKVGNLYDVNMPHCQVLAGSEWGGDFTAPETIADIIGKRYNLFGGYAWFRLNPDCVFYMMGGSCVRPQRSDYVYIESGRFLFDTTMPDKSLSVELANVIINPGQALFCVGYNKEYDCTDIYVLSGEIELAAKTNFFDYYQLSATGQNSATLSTDGFVVGVEKEIQNYFGPLLGLPTLASGPTPTLDLQFIYEGFDYSEPESETANRPKDLHHLNGGWGWSGPWRELGALDSKVVFGSDLAGPGPQGNSLSFTDTAGTQLASKPGKLLTATGAHTHCSRKIGMNIVPPALLTADNKIGQDHSVLWLSFLAQLIISRAAVRMRLTCIWAVMTRGSCWARVR